jgi:glycolate oxidase iron-sulfur subunit
MQTRLDNNDTLAQEKREIADSVLRRCVHCGFCNATCPTYAVTGNELDGPRGRIYLIKQALESGTATRLTQQHLDRCLTCMACESTCPSGVRYHSLLDIGREAVDTQVRRPWREALQRAVLRAVVSRPRVLALLARLAGLIRFALPATWQSRLPPSPNTVQVPAPGHSHHAAISSEHQSPRQVVMLGGCAETVLTPATRTAAMRVLATQQITTREVRGAGCCGALHFHFGDRAGGLERARRNVDALADALDDGASYVVSTASGCGAFIRDYTEILHHDPDYHERAHRVSTAHRDVCEILNLDLLSSATRAAPAAATATAFHCPCTMQHAQGLDDRVPAVLAAAGIDSLKAPGPARCCGSAGAYSVLQPGMASTLGAWRAEQLTATGAARILTANVGCQQHLARFTQLPVQHWLEAVAAQLDAAAAADASPPVGEPLPR